MSLSINLNAGMPFAFQIKTALQICAAVHKHLASAVFPQNSKWLVLSSQG